MAMVNDCNFGNPERSESFWFFSQAVKGMADFCKKLRIPVVGGKVSFYNENEITHTVIKPAPVIMIIGLIEGEENIITLPFKKAGDYVLLIGDTKKELGGSEYHSVIYDIEGGIPPKVDETKIKATWDCLFELYKKHLVRANHDINKGGVVITVTEMCFKNNLGADVDFTGCLGRLKDYEFLFSESVGRFVIETEPKDLNQILDIARKYNVLAKKIGVLISKPEISIKGLKKKDIKLDIKKIKKLHDSTIPSFMEI
jgi:phosphoribosylformylglycinamidine synthase